MVTATRTKEFKLVRTDESTKLYKLPNETDNVASISQDEYDELGLFAGESRDIKADSIDTPPKNSDLGERTVGHLRDMGYLE